MQTEILKMPHNHAPRYATIDIGTNSIKFHIGERLSDGTWRKVIDRAEVVRLGEGLRETGVFNEQAMARQLPLLPIWPRKRNARRCRSRCRATMGMRNAGNAEQFIAAIQAHCGVSIEVISGEEEARLAYLAVQAGLGLPDVPWSCLTVAAAAHNSPSDMAPPSMIALVST